jgi:hypothetical protein
MNRLGVNVLLDSVSIGVIANKHVGYRSYARQILLLIRTGKLEVHL